MISRRTFLKFIAAASGSGIVPSLYAQEKAGRSVAGIPVLDCCNIGFNTNCESHSGTYRCTSPVPMKVADSIIKSFRVEFDFALEGQEGVIEMRKKSDELLLRLPSGQAFRVRGVVDGFIIRVPQTGIVTGKCRMEIADIELLAEPIRGIT